MSYVNKYIIEFASVYKKQWRIDIQEDGWTGEVFNLVATGDPLHFEYDSDSDAFNEPIRPSKAIINVRSISDFQLIDFYTDYDFRLKVLIYCDSVLFWQGFIITGEYEEPYDSPPYPVKLTAIDGLNYLKQLLFAESVDIVSGVETITYYETRTVESKIVIDILGKIFYTGFREYVNIFEDSMSSSVDDSPFNQTVIDVDVFRDMNCWDVMTELLKKYNAVIRQVSGEIVIYRPTELVNDFVYGRIFTAWNTKTSTAYIPNQYIKRAGITSTLRQFPGSALMIKRAAKKISINQDYGYKQSWIDNYAIREASYSYVTFTYQSWSPGATWGHEKITGINQGICLSQTGGSMPSTNGVSQSFGGLAIVSSNSFVFSFDFLTRNVTGSILSGQSAYIKIKADYADYWLMKGGDDIYAWTGSLQYIGVGPMDIPKGISGWTTITKSFNNLPAAGPYTITLYGIDTASACQIVYDNLKFYSTSDKIVRKQMPIVRFKWYDWLVGSALGGWDRFEGKVNQIIHGRGYNELIDNQEVVMKNYDIQNAANGNDIIENYILGDVTDSEIDNVIEQFQGALVVNLSPLIPSSSWNMRGSSAPLLELIGGEIGQQYSRPKQLVQMYIQEYAESYTGLSVDGSTTVDDTGVTVDSTLITVDSD